MDGKTSGQQVDPDQPVDTNLKKIQCDVEPLKFADLKKYVESVDHDFDFKQFSKDHLVLLAMCLYQKK